MSHFEPMSIGEFGVELSPEAEGNVVDLNSDTVSVILTDNGNAGAYGAATADGDERDSEFEFAAMDAIRFGSLGELTLGTGASLSDHRYEDVDDDGSEEFIGDFPVQEAGFDGSEEYAYVWLLEEGAHETGADMLHSSDVSVEFSG